MEKANIVKVTARVCRVCVGYNVCWLIESINGKVHLQEFLLENFVECPEFVIAFDSADDTCKPVLRA